MPDDRRNQSKSNKDDPKEQRKPRQGRQKIGAANKKAAFVENKTAHVEKTEGHKVTVPLQPTYEDPGPEFYKNLKRETDDILKITEEENSKYKKKEIQSNWSKYEMPIKSYDELEEENMGADYEKLAETPMSIGGHFQFKHEKSWDVNIGPSLYDKYFEINMNDLVTALSTVPFYERNSIDKDIFSSTDILTMNNKAIKNKQKYYNDKSYTTTELEGQNRMLNILKEVVCEIDDKKKISKNIQLEEKEDAAQYVSQQSSIEKKPSIIENHIKLESETKHDINEINTPALKSSKETNTNQILKNTDELISDDIDNLISNKDIVNTDIPEIKLESKIPKADNCSANTKQPKDSVIQSPEDLEKWLDDFLDE
ncbi:uncharacterized protein LOC131842158 isoform X2 [Achroia grisella]|uniref:uncharacterized protein LOC131842158 isoform X2 n=1 Tax=Achroia grisella TaxID=688607 RepID=UPI0027D2A19D|nr:uncharacterized protein LOC131842158 isoform X2 [Achroia grisella]